MKRVAVLKLGGELIENGSAAEGDRQGDHERGEERPGSSIVHGGGREIDAALAQVGIPKRQVDGLRVTDADTLNIVVSVLAGSINTKFVAAINAAGGKAVGLTGADAGVAPVEKAAPHKATNGETVDLGMVGTPIKAPSPGVIEALCRAGYMPVIACVGASKNGKLFNVNADTLAGSLAARLKAKRLVIAGATPGVLDKKNQTIPQARQGADREAGEVGNGECRHGREAGGVPGGAEGRREERRDRRRPRAGPAGEGASPVRRRRRRRK